MNGLERIGSAGRRPARLDLAEDERPAVEGDDVELAPSGTEVPLQDRVATPLQML